jgi:hypothetical protein
MIFIPPFYCKAGICRSCIPPLLHRAQSHNLTPRRSPTRLNPHKEEMEVVLIMRSFGRKVIGGAVLLYLLVVC